jgi:uncharacterized membrane protein
MREIGNLIPPIARRSTSLLLAPASPTCSPLRMLRPQVGNNPLTRHRPHGTFQVLMTPPLRMPQPSLENTTQSAQKSAPASFLQPAQQPALTLFAIGLIGLGVLSLIYGDFAMTWQPVAPWFPGRTVLAYLTGALEIITALGLLFRASSRWAVRVLLPGVVLWQLLKLPDLFAAPKVEGVYLGFGELAILFAGGFTLFACLADLAPASRFTFLTTERTVRIVRRYYGLWIIPIGLSHFIYHDATVHLVPAWLPARSFIAYLTGAGQMASGLGILFNVLPRIAAWAEAGQIALYTLLIWLPAVALPTSGEVSAVFGKPDPHLTWTAFFISWFFAAGASIVAQNDRGIPEA